MHHEWLLDWLAMWIGGAENCGNWAVKTKKKLDG